MEARIRGDVGLKEIHDISFMKKSFKKIIHKIIKKLFNVYLPMTMLNLGIVAI